jgi:cation diffusion facilitator CzcD-associated flavoprotein CzcO
MPDVTVAIIGTGFGGIGMAVALERAGIYYYPAIARPNVSLVTEGIAEVRDRAVVTSDGRAHPADTLIFGTGFHVTDFPLARRIFGSDGASLAGRWSGTHAKTAFRGTTTAGFPNLFVLTGPNTGLGHSSQVYMIEAQIRYVLGALGHAGQRGADRVEVRPAAQAAYERMVQRKMRSTVWATGGCRSWYLDEHGRNVTLWPGFTFTYARQTRRFDPSRYDLAGPASATGASGSGAASPAASQAR